MDSFPATEVGLLLFVWESGAVHVLLLPQRGIAYPGLCAGFVSVISAHSNPCHDACIHGLLAACKRLGHACAQVCYSSWNGNHCTSHDVYVAAANSNAPF